MRYKAPLTVACILSVVAGGLSAVTEDTNVSASLDNWPAEAEMTLGLSQDLYAQMLKSIEQSDMLPEPYGILPTSQTSFDQTDPENDPLYIPPFPEILSVSIVDGLGRVDLRGEEGAPVHIKEGDTLSSGWQLERINLTRIVAVFGETRREFPVNYNGHNEGPDMDTPPEDL